jgi:hypothetical protein
LLKIHVFSSGYRIPVAYGTKDTAIPILLPFTYTILKIKDRAFKTRRRHQAAIDELYQFFEGKEIKLDEVLIQGEFYRLFDHLHEFFMVHIYRNGDPSPGTLMEKVQAIREYLHWAFGRYIRRQVADEKRAKAEANLELRLITFFQSYTPLSNFTRIRTTTLFRQSTGSAIT